MEYLDKNYVIFDNNSKTKNIFLLGKIKNTTLDLLKVFGNPIKKSGINKWIFKMNEANFTVYQKKENTDWDLSSNTSDEFIIKQFLTFLSEARKAVRGARSTHKNIPVYTPDTYQLKGKIALYRVPPKEPPTEIKIFKEKQNIPRKNKFGKLVFKDHLEFNPNLTPKEGSDFYFVEAEPGDDIINKIITMVKERIPKKFNLNPVQDIQLLCPMQRGGAGARSLNIELQKVLNPNHTEGIVKFGQIFAIGDKIMQTENNYDKEVYNGDIGIIKAINEQDQEIIINFYNRDVNYDYTDLDQITLAYATTIHKSQGSEYPAVIIPITMQSYLMLRRNLIYTAITRGKKLVVIIGQKKALAMAVKDTTSSHRYSKLREWLVA